MADIHCHVRIEQALDALGIRQGSTPCNPGTTGEANLMANVGDGEGEVYRDKVGVTFNLRTLKAGPNITIATVDDVITIESATGAGNVTGPDPSTLRAIATYANTNGTLLYDNVVRIEDSAAGSNYRAIQILSEEGTPAWRDVVQLRQEIPNGTSGGPMVRIASADTMAEIWASEDPFVVTPAGRGLALHERIAQDWVLEHEGGITITNGDSTPVIYLQTTGINGGRVSLYTGDRNPEGNIAADPGSMYYRKDAANSLLYQHRGSSFGTTGWYPLGSAITADDISIQVVGTPTLDNVQDTINQFGMAGTADNLSDYITDSGGGQIDVAGGSGWIRSTSVSDGELFSFEWSALANQTIPTDTTRYVGVEYNSGSPQAVIRTSGSWNHKDEFQLGSVVNQGGTLHILNNAQRARSFGSWIFERFYETMPFQRAERLGGIIPAGTGVRYLTVSAGELYDGFTEFDISSIDTTGSDTFDVYYRNGSGGWTEVSAQSQWDNAYWDDGTGTLNTLGVSKYGIHWLYIEADGDLVLLYGQGEYNSALVAETAPVPSTVPPRIDAHGRLLGRLIFQQGASSHTSLVNVWDEVFAGSASSGDVYGPAGATDEAIAIFDGSTGKLIQNSVAKVTQPSGDINAIEIIQPSTPDGWQPVIKYEDLPANGMSGGNTVIVGNTVDPLLLRTDSNGLWANDGTSYGLVLWEKMADSWVLEKQGTVKPAVADTTAPLTLETTGTNGAASSHFVGTRDPVGNVTGSPGSFYTRVNGTSSRLYQHQGSSSSNTGWVDISDDAISIDWTFSGTTTDSDPGANYFRLNNATQSAASQMYVYNSNTLGIAFSTLLYKLGSNDVVLVQQKSNPANYHLFSVTGDAIVATNYHKIPISSVDSGSSLVDGEDCRITFFFSKDSAGGPYVHGSKTTTQMLAISSPAVGDTCYNTDKELPFWWTGNTWQCSQTFEAVNNTPGGTMYEGDPVTGSSSTAGRVTTTATSQHPNMLGVNVFPASSVGDYLTIAYKGIWGVWVYGTTAIGDAIVNFGAGLATSVGGATSVSQGIFALAAESRIGSTTSSVIDCWIGPVSYAS